LTKLSTLVCFALALWPLGARADVRPLPTKPAAAAAHAPSGALKSTARGELQRQAFSPERARAGVLLLQTPEDESAWLAPQVSNEVEIHVTGPIARARVLQAFENPSDEVVEAVYVFPLPETAAVDGLTLTIGKRRIVGEVRERAEAQQVFDRARKSGKVASLLEQERPNLFTTHVANILPGEVVEVELSYQQEVRYDAGRFSLSFPSTLTPRYIPGATDTAAEGFSGSGWGTNTRDVPDAERITPPVRLGDGPTLDISVFVDAGFPLKRLTSSSHALDIERTGAGPGVFHALLATGPVLADHDFQLEWEPEAGSVPRTALFEEQFQGRRYALLMVLPPDAALDGAGRMARELTFVIDTSGSMAGTSIEQARRALESGLRQLRAGDQFNVIEFNSTARRLFPESVPVTQANVDKALGWVGALAADGGTEMLSALQLALGDAQPGERVRQVVFITDGSVGNEPELFRFIVDHLGRQRLFTVGIGSAPNQYFMHDAARFGRGTFTSIADVSEVSLRMNELWSKLSAPVSSDLELTWAGSPQAETWPERLPDLYRGEPLVVVARLDAKASAVELRGRRASQAFVNQLGLTGTTNSGGKLTSRPRERGIHRLWARRKIESAMDRLIEGQAESDIRPEVTALALEHHLVSKYTSLVAVDTTRSVESPGPSVPVANALPAGSTMFGNLPQTATPGPTCLLLSFVSAAGAWSLRRRGGV